MSYVELNIEHSMSFNLRYWMHIKGEYFLMGSLGNIWKDIEKLAILPGS